MSTISSTKPIGTFTNRDWPLMNMPSYIKIFEISIIRPITRSRTSIAISISTTGIVSSRTTTVIEFGLSELADARSAMKLKVERLALRHPRRRAKPRLDNSPFTTCVVALGDRHLALCAVGSQGRISW